MLIKMKSFKSYIKGTALTAAAVAMAFGMASCDDMLDCRPQGSFTKDQIGPDEAVDMMTSAYATLMCHYFGNNESFAGPINNWVIDLRSDDALKGGDNVTMEGYMHQLEIGNVESNSDILNFKWRNNYYSISRCNNAIKALLGATQLSDTERDAMVGEMKTLRAYYYFDMYRLFDRFPYFDEEVADPSGCRADEYTRPEIMQFIYNDLQWAYGVMVERQSQAARFNKYVAAAVMARVALFNNDFATAETYADYVIKSGQYQLYANFLDISKPEFNNQMESVMAVQFSSANEGAQYNYCNCLNLSYNFTDGNKTDTYYGNGDDFYIGSQDLINAFATDDNGLPYLNDPKNSHEVGNTVSNQICDYAGNVDPRLDFTFGRIGFPWRGLTYDEWWCRNLPLYGQYSPKKAYTAPDSPYCQTGIVPWGASSLNYIIIRYADVLLMKAEALIEQDKQLDEARSLINQVRARANRSMDTAYAPVDFNPFLANYKVEQYPAAGWTKDYARKAVRHERRIEFAMEGLRWFDLLRWGIAEQTVNDYYKYEVKFQPYYSTAHLSAKDFYFPVPLNQADNAGDLYKIEK